MASKTIRPLASGLILLLGLAVVRAAPRRTNSSVVVDERLAALRAGPNPRASLLKRLGRGRRVTIIRVVKGRDPAGGEDFCRVAVTRRTRGWLLCASLISPGARSDDERLWRLIAGSEEFERLARAAIFLEAYRHSPRRPAVLFLAAEEAERAARELTREAARRLKPEQISAPGVPARWYFLNYRGLDRYDRIGVKFLYDEAVGGYRYDGACWREIVRRYPRGAEAAEARRRLGAAPANAGTEFVGPR